MKKFGNFLWGLVFITIGVIWALNALGITNINIFFDGWWTLFIIIPSFIGLFKNKNKTGDLVFLCVGILLLLSCRDIISFDIIWKLMIPIILIAIGLSIIFNDAINKKINDKIKSLNKNDLEEYCATFSEQNVVLNNEEFKGANLNAIFGSVKFNMENADISSEQIINASAIFGGITIITPKNVNIKVKSTPIFGGINNKTVQIVGENIPTIYINAFCMFGGVDIK